MSDIQSAAVKSLAEQIVKAINTITDKNNKSYVNARVTRYGSGGSSSGGGSWSGTITPSQITGLYDVVSSYLIDAEENAAAGDETAIKIMSTLNGISDVRITNATIKSAQIDDLSSSYAEFIRLVSEKATIKEVDTEKVYAELADIGLSNINRADIGYAQIKDLSAGTAIFREGSGGKLYLDRLIVDDANIANLTAGKLMLQKDDGKFYQISVDDSGAVATTEVQVENENIKDATIGGAKILESTIGTRELNVDEMTASTAFIGKLATSVISTPKFGDNIDLTNNSSITLLDSKIGLVVDSSSTTTELTLTDKALTAIADKVDLSGNESVTAKVKTEVTGAIDEKFPQQDTAPENPTEGDLWLDTGVFPNVLKIYKKDSTTQELAWNTVNDVDKSALASRVTAAELKITDDAIVQTVTSSSSYSGLVDRVSTAESKLTDSAMETTIANSEALSAVKQTADKIGWLIASGTSASTMQMTDDAYALISKNITISTDKIKITSGDQIDSSVINALDLANNTTVKSLETDIGTAQSTADTAKTNAATAQDGVDSLSTRMGNVELDLTQDKIVSKVTSSETYKTLDGQVTTNKNNISSVTQTANKVEWIVAEDATASAVKLTSDAYTAIADNIDLSANNTIKISSADQIDISAVNALNLNSNGTITVLTGNVSAAQKAADEAKILGFTASDEPPSAPDKDYRWLDTKNIPNQLRIWRGLEKTPSDADMTVATKIEESITAANNTITINNTNDSIVSNITITVTDGLKTESEVKINGETIHIEIENGVGSYSFEPTVVLYTITVDIATTTATYTCSGWKTINDTTSLSNQTSEAQSDATQALTNADSASKSAAAAQKSIDEFGDYIKISESSVDIINGTDANKRVSVSSSGVDIQTSDDNKVSITSQGVDIYAGGKKTSSFISNGVVLGNYFLWYPEESGGLAFNVYEVT